MGNTAALLCFVFAFMLSHASFAKTGITVSNSEAVNNPMAANSSLGATQRSSQNALALRLRVSCFGTNLRSVTNPVSPTSNITMTGQIKTSTTGEFKDFSLKFPASAVLDAAATPVVTIPAGDLGGALVGAKAGIANNLLSVSMKSTVTSSINPSTATISEAQAVFQLQNIQFIQSGTGGGGPYMATDGPLSVGSLTLTQSSDGKTYDVETSFPGQDGYCGGFYSPLMVFFDEKRPSFNNVVDFNMGHGLKTYWPEKEHPGYFIALPVNGRIKDVNQLFGESKKFGNGFEKLATFDANKDGVIDRKDPVFKKLVLWKDVSGSGKFSAKDSIALSKKIKSIDLKYRSVVEAVGRYAEYRQNSKAELVATRGQPPAKAVVVDVWFKPYTEVPTKEIRKLSSN